VRYNERKPSGPFEHRPHPALTNGERPIYIALVGCGGNGSQMLTGLARLHLALRALGHPGMHLCAYDGDAVSAANIGRQLFFPGDIGRNKATILVHRLNSAYGLDWYAEPAHFGRVNADKRVDIVVSCVDTRETRAFIGDWLEAPGGTPLYWMDLGNRAADGQVILGIPAWNRKHRRMWGRLPTVLELFPEIDGPGARKLDKADRAPSCSLAEALERQELFINQIVCTQALQLLWQVLRHRSTTYHGVFVNAVTGRVNALPCDIAAWERFGYYPRPATPSTKRDALG
jgi:PRTRC genetic system ThiF family protein